MQLTLCRICAPSPKKNPKPQRQANSLTRRRLLFSLILFIYFFSFNSHFRLATSSLLHRCGRRKSPKGRSLIRFMCVCVCGARAPGCTTLTLKLKWWKRKKDFEYAPTRREYDYEYSYSNANSYAYSDSYGT